MTVSDVASTCNGSLRDQAYERIKEKIITCGLRPGEVVSEAALRSELGIARTPVHQALHRLTVDGLVDVLPRKGVIVRPLSLREALEIVEVRLLNETHGARLAAENATSVDVVRLRTNLERMGEAAAQNDIVGCMRLDRAFHALLSAAGGNATLSDFLARLHDRSLRFWYVSLRVSDHHRHVREQHEEIVDAVARSDPEGAAGAMRAHVEAFRENVIHLI